MKGTEPGIVGKSTDAAVDAVVGGDGSRALETVREALDPVTTDGRVRRAALEEAISDTSKVVATAETRVELADIALEDARDAADGVVDLDAVRFRLNGFEDRLGPVESRVAELGIDLPRPAAEISDPDALYELVLELREVAARAQGVVRTADDLQFDLERFESWLTRPDRRHDEFAEDLTLVRESVAELEAVVDVLNVSQDPAGQWADATMRTDVAGLLVADLHAERDELREWADRRGTDFRETLGEDLYALESRQLALAARLAERSRPAWREQFGDAIEALAADLGSVEPPVEWGSVKEQLTDRRTSAFDDAPRSESGATIR